MHTGYDTSWYLAKCVLQTDTGLPERFCSHRPDVLARVSGNLSCHCQLPTMPTILLLSFTPEKDPALKQKSVHGMVRLGILHF